MEPSLTSLTFTGTIAEAIAEAKRHKKLFVVYTSGENPESKLLEASSWFEPRVSATLAKHCIFLHILEGSSEATYFSAIYPQKSPPSIAAIGYNGVLIWQQEGFVAADVLASCLEKAWLNLHLQESAAAVLTAALSSGASGIPSSYQNAPDTYEPSSSSTNDQNLSLDTHQPLNSGSKPETDNHVPDLISTAEMVSKIDCGTFSTSCPKVVGSRQLDESDPTIDTEIVSLPFEEKVKNVSEGSCPVPEKDLEFCENHLRSVDDVSKNTLEDRDVVEIQESIELKKDYVFLSIRLPDGSSLQANFSAMDTLRVIRDYIIDSQTNILGSFNLAIPYPRRVFSVQDLDCTISELGLFNRQTLIVVSQSQTDSNIRGAPVHSSEVLESSSESNEGYWASLKRIISYINPLSYLNRGVVADSSPRKESGDSIWKYGQVQNNSKDLGSFAGGHSPDRNTTATGRNDNSNNRKKPSRFGDNIHTLRHEEDHSDDRNVFWNGNSTQFGGNDDGK